MIKEENYEWIIRHLESAKHRATFSKDPSTKVGAVLVEPDYKRDHSYGYNGFPRGVKDINLTDRDYKYPRTVHAELNCILNSDRNLKGHILFCTLAPCAGCAAAIIQKEIAVVYHIQENFTASNRWHESHAVAISMFEEAGVECYGVYMDRGSIQFVPMHHQKMIIESNRRL